MPGIGRACFENLDTVSVTVEVEGEGSVYVGNGYATEGDPKTWDFARYAAGCPTLCTAPTGCAPNTITLTAAPEADWAFLHWACTGPVMYRIADVYDLQLTPQGHLLEHAIQLPLEFACEMVAVFDYREGVADLDLVHNLGELLVYIGELQDADDVMNLMWDRGGLESDDSGEFIFVGNGIPDVAEFYLLQQVLNDHQLDLNMSSGVISTSIYQAWSQNLQEVQGALTGVDPAIQHAVAAYLTIGELGMTLMIRDLVSAHCGVTLDLEVYNSEAARYFAPDADCDNDGWTNEQEWAAIVEEALGNGEPPDERSLESYAAGATDGQAPPEAPTGTSGAYCPSLIAAEGGEICPLVTPSVNLTHAWAQVDGQNWSIVVRASGSREDGEELSIGTAHPVPLAQKITVRAENVNGEYGRFKSWHAPNLPIHGTDRPSETCIIPIAAATYSITPTFYPTHAGTLRLPSTQIPADVTLTVSGPKTNVTRVYSDDVYVGVDVRAQVDAPISVSHDMQNAMGWAEWVNVQTYDTQILLPDIGELADLEPHSGGGAVNTLTHRASTNIGLPWIARGGMLQHGARVLHCLTTTTSPFNMTSGVCEIPLSANWVSETCSVNDQGKRTWVHKVELKKILTLGRDQCKGYATAYPARKYYDAPLPGGEGKVVAVSASAMPGYAFAGWGGTGTCWLDAETDTNGDFYIPANTPSLSLDATAGAHSTVYIKMDRSKSIVPKWVRVPVAIMGVFSNVTPDSDPIYNQGHAWIEVYALCSEYETAYGVYPGGPFPPLNSYVKTKDDLHGAYQRARYYYLYKDQYRALMEYIRNETEEYRWYHTVPCTGGFNCSTFASNCVRTARGEWLQVCDLSIGLGEPIEPNGMADTPRQLSRSISERETERATSVVDPLP